MAQVFWAVCLTRAVDQVLIWVTFLYTEGVFVVLCWDVAVPMVDLVAID